ncbi:MAG: hypothetical protein ACLQMS_13915 [Desulfomonilaceae bacterium]
MKTESSRSVSLYRAGSRTPILLVLILIGTVTFSLLVSCDVTPVQPEEVFILYRERMNADKVQDARKLLSPDSLNLVKEIDEQYKLGQPPEKTALLNILDPLAPPTLVKMDEGLALLQVRTLKGRTRLIRLTKPDPKSPWKVDMTEELRSLQAFLEAKEALSGLQRQAGEFAASWKAFDNQLEKMGGPEPEPKPQIKEAVRKPVKPKHTPKRPKKEEKPRAK